MIQDGAWSGKRCFIYGGGESLLDHDLSKLEGERIIGCNLAWKVKPQPQIQFVFDLRVMDLLIKDPAWKKWDGLTFYFEREGESKKYRDWGTPTRPMRGWSHSLQDGLIRRSNCGLAAINLADVLGASPIFLIGFDCKPTKKLTTNYHGDYPDDWRTNAEDVYRNMVNDFEDTKYDAHGMVVNLNTRSAIKAYPFLEYDKLFRKVESHV